MIADAILAVLGIFTGFVGGWLFGLDVLETLGVWFMFCGAAMFLQSMRYGS